MIRKRILTLSVASTFFFSCGPAQVSSLDTPEQKSGYAIGMDMGINLKEVAGILDMDALMQGLNDVIGGDSTLLTTVEVRAALQAFSIQAQQHQESGRTEVADRNKAEGEAFLAANSQRDGITTTASGLQYEVMTQGTGAKPTGADRVRVHYAGTFTDGTPFESTYETNTPAEFQVGGVIPGWTEALQLMSVGSKYRLFITGDLAYGEMGSGSMEPNKTLVFEVELLDIL